MPTQKTNAIQVQWNLDRTVHKGLDVALDFVRIATQDNVQPIALMACERFGNTLPISRATRLLIEGRTRPAQENVLLRFARLAIRKGGGETLQRFTGSVAGLNFLALAAAIAPTMALEEAGNTIQKMLDRSAADKVLVPPAYQIRAILDLLEPQLVRVGFLDKCYEWDHWLRRRVTPYQDTYHQFPSSDGIGRTVTALRDLARLGDRRIDSVVITCHSCTAWIVSFVEWCLGVSPSLCHDNGDLVLAQPESKVTIVIPIERRALEPIKVESFQASGSLFDVVHIAASQELEGYKRIFSGMVSLPVHAEQILQSTPISTLGLRAIIEALVYGIPHARRYLVPPAHGVFNENIPGDEFDRRATQLSHFFPSEKVLYLAMSAYLGRYMDERTKGFRKLPSGTTIFDLPLLKQWIEDSGNICTLCKRFDDENDEEARLRESSHLKSHIKPIIATLLSNVLALSLIEADYASLYLHFNDSYRIRAPQPGEKAFHEGDLSTAVEWTLNLSDPSPCSAQTIITHVRKLLGHDYIPQDHASWIASSLKGQVLIPVLYESMQLRNAPSMQFYCMPGILALQDQLQGPRLRQVECETLLPQGHGYVPRRMMTIPASEVDTLSKFGSFDPEWKMRIDGESMFVHLSTNQPGGESSKVDPLLCLNQSTMLWFAAKCSHPRDPLPDDAVMDYEFVHPHSFLIRLKNPSGTGKIAVYAVRGNDRLRVAILGTLPDEEAQPALVVDGGDACLSCSLALCRRESAFYLIC